ncbi:MAG: hypothetical protein HOP11_14920 [Saprospiraceae bacterium]|nr:hypothetical protein [Saprospiraceae bacterium]
MKFEKFLPFVVAGIGFYMFVIQFCQWDFSRVPGDFGDARLNNFFLEHGFRYLSGEEKSFWNAPFMYPDRNTLTYSDNHIGTLPIYSIFRVLGFDREGSYQGWFLIIVLLNFFSSYFAFRKFKFNIPLSCIGAYIFSFSMMMINKSVHAQLLPIFYIPWVFYFLLRFYATAHFKNVIYAGFFIAMQLYCSFYTGLFTVIIVLFLLLGILFKKTSLIRSVIVDNKSILVYSGSLLLIALLLLPLFLPYYQRATEFGYKSYDDVKLFLLTCRNFLMPIEDSFLWNKMRFFNNNVQFFWEKQLWIGGFLFVGFLYYLGLRIFGVITSRGIHFLLFVSIICTILLFVNWGEGISVYEYFRRIPGFSALKAVSRIIIPLMFPITLLILFFIRALFLKNRINTALYYILLGVVIIDQAVPERFFTLKSYNKFESQKEINGIVSKISEAKTVQPDSKAMAYMPEEKTNAVPLQIAAALAGQALGIPTVNGYSSTCHGKFGPFWEKYDSASLREWLDFNTMDVLKDKILIVK